VSAYFAGQSMIISMCAPTGSGRLHRKLTPLELMSHVTPVPHREDAPFCDTRKCIGR
jgi:hypothetical protein